MNEALSEDGGGHDQDQETGVANANILLIESELGHKLTAARYRSPEIDITNWRQHMECAGVDPGIFVTDTQHPKGISVAAQIKRAREFCGQCAVADLCLLSAGIEGDKSSIRGGLSARKRNSLRRQQRL